MVLAVLGPSLERGKGNVLDLAIVCSLPSVTSTVTSSMSLPVCVSQGWKSYWVDFYSGCLPRSSWHTWAISEAGWTVCFGWMEGLRLPADCTVYCAADPASFLQVRRGRHFHVFSLSSTINVLLSTKLHGLVYCFSPEKYGSEGTSVLNIYDKCSKFRVDTSRPCNYSWQIMKMTYRNQRAITTCEGSLARWEQA